MAQLTAIPAMPITGNANYREANYREANYRCELTDR
jgi:hypothetical protein